MAAKQARARSFGQVAELYERRRPGYPEALFDDLLALAGPGSRALEAGAGTGRATIELARRGIEVIAFEHDPAMAALAARTTDGLPVHVEQRPFEDWDGEPGTFDLVASAQAWHWIDKERGSATAQRALRPGGLLAVWWNQAGERDGPTWEAIDAAYQRTAPELMRSVLNRPVHEVEADALELSGFGPMHHHCYRWTKRYDTTSYTELLQTHSDHRQLPPQQLAALTRAVADAIDEVAGGEFDYAYRTDVLMARRA